VAAAGWLGAIRIVGNRAIASDALESALALHEAIGDGAAVDPYLLGLDTDRIRAAYLRRGFFAVTVTPTVEQRGARQVVIFTIAEGRRAVSRVEITGLPPEVAAAAARALVGLGDGEPFDYDAYDAARQPLADLVENAGYAHVRVNGAVTADPGGAIAAVRYAVEPGPRWKAARRSVAPSRRRSSPRPGWSRATSGSRRGSAAARCLPSARWKSRRPGAARAARSRSAAARPPAASSRRR
jgi:outer membrane protein assembly factor BamA